MISRAAAVLLLAVLTWAVPALGHDVPSDAQVRIFAKPEAGTLHVLIRLPLSLLLNVDLPKQGPGYLALAQIDEGLQRAVIAADRDIAWYEDGRRLVLRASRARISTPSDKSFADFANALANISGPRLSSSTYVFWNQGYLDAHLEYAIDSPTSQIKLDFRVAPALRDRLRVDLRYEPPGGPQRAFDLGTAQGPVVLDPRWYEAAWTFLRSGFEHILQGPDHLLFLVCLVMPFRRLDMYLVGVVSAFTVAHSITLISAAYGLAPQAAWFVPGIETLIAASILYMAIENVLAPNLSHRWIASALFGLVHGFGFSFVLQSQLQFAGSSLLLSLLAFNVGVELGQLLVIALVLAALSLLRRAKPSSEFALTVVVSALAGHVAWHWFTDRGQSLLASLPQPWFDPDLSMQMLLVLMCAALVLNRSVRRRLFLAWSNAAARWRRRTP